MRAVMLVLVGVALTACAGGSKFKTEFPVGSEVYQVDGILSAEVTQIENLTGGKNKKIIVTVNVRNLTDKEIRFKRDDIMVELAFGGVRAKDAKLWNQELDVDIKPSESKKKIWAFEGREQMIEAGTYKGTIRNINYFENGTHTPVGADLEFSVTVPGPAATAAESES